MRSLKYLSLYMWLTKVDIAFSKSDRVVACISVSY